MLKRQTKTSKIDNCKYSKRLLLLAVLALLKMNHSLQVRNQLIQNQKIQKQALEQQHHLLPKLLKKIEKINN